MQEQIISFQKTKKDHPINRFFIYLICFKYFLSICKTQSRNNKKPTLFCYVLFTFYLRFIHFTIYSPTFVSRTSRFNKDASRYGKFKIWEPCAD